MKCSIVTHRGAQRILVCFSFNRELSEEIKQLSGARWSRTLRGWHLPDTPAFRKRFGLNTGDAAEPAGSVETEIKDPRPVNEKVIPALVQQLHLKRYSASTQRTYCSEMVQLLHYAGSRDINLFTKEEIRTYLEYCTAELKLSEHTLHSRINALKFYYEQVLGQDKMFFDIPRPKKPFQLPRVLNREEVAALINAIENLKHRAMIMLAYGCGLRVSEVTNIKIGDVDGGRRILFIRRGKGKKDRVVSLSAALLVMLREYYKTYRPVTYLFEGADKGTRYSIRSLQAIMQQAKQRARIKRPGNIHLLRHSFATHLLDKGTDVVLIQRLLGHNDIKTTLKYLHVTHRDLHQILSPLEDIRDMLK